MFDRLSHKYMIAQAIIQQFGVGYCMMMDLQHVRETELEPN
jgi:hypothetical protein